ncbi:MAG: nuclear transport factor 2 family protein [Bacteroidales bacterium]|nr:nuclear transport factor 2 family protein [Bacteroidales bacterium]
MKIDTEMKMLIALLPALVACAAPHSEGEAGGIADGALSEVEAFLDSWNSAMLAADTARLGAMMDDGIVLRHITGATQTKREWLAEVANGSMRYHRVEKGDVRITFGSDGSTSLSFISAITATIWGSHGTWTLNGTMRLVRRDGVWVRVE